MVATSQKERGEAVTSPYAVEEAKRNLTAKRPDWAPRLDSVLDGVSIAHTLADMTCAGLPPEDVPILAGAVGSRCTNLVTGDRRHFGTLHGKTVHGVLIVSCTTMADILFDLGWKPAADWSRPD